MALAQHMLTKDLCAEVFDYDAVTGILYNRISRGPNSPKGGEAGFENGNGYRRVGLGGVQAYTHQIVWIMHYGSLPIGEIDHVDGDAKNNRIENLRITDRYGNTQNTAKRSHSRQPYKGVRKTKSGRWAARITANNQRSHLGTFSNPDEAYHAYCEASKALHGEFGRVC